ncbi:hypothetical protein CGLO_14686 [Colletotrichum gloeosporioides Cg-14]|uniref:Uncharacterized protein n=1 Tax=Colletotrichum gloeosporioides (strain Cg-14) TaxID=1237896 RepID=T0LD68_COLGC|nr:hypothetical protein CGLO_14686 [Colletotrichum gloeosporioides Cg-14]
MASDEFLCLSKAYSGNEMGADFSSLAKF